jgi:hypothetical protein
MFWVSESSMQKNVVSELVNTNRVVIVLLIHCWSDKLHVLLQSPLMTSYWTQQVPCRTAMKGSFPLNGTYFQVNEVFQMFFSRIGFRKLLAMCLLSLQSWLSGFSELLMQVFADHKSSHDPIHVVREQLWNLERRMVYFGTSVPSIFKGYDQHTYHLFREIHL